MKKNTLPEEFCVKLQANPARRAKSWLIPKQPSRKIHGNAVIAAIL
jgi:hypothetical protein